MEDESARQPSQVLLASAPGLSDDQELQQGTFGNATAEPEDDMGELDFTYDDSMLQGDEEEEPAVFVAQPKEQEQQESERSKKEQFDRSWGPTAAHALPADNHDVPAHNRHSHSEHADRQRDQHRYQRPLQSNRTRDSIRSQNHLFHSRDQGMQDQGRRMEGSRGGLVSGARRQPPSGESGPSQHYSRPAAPSESTGQPGSGEFDVRLLFNMLNGSMAAPPSFAPVSDDGNQHKRKHEQMQASAPMSLGANIPASFLSNLTPDFIRNIQQASQQPPLHHQQQAQLHQQIPQMHRMHPDGQMGGGHPHQHNMMGPAVPPPRPPQEPPPGGPAGPHLHSAGFFAGASNFGPMTSNAMDMGPQSGQPQRQGTSGWSLSHGMDGSNRQEPTLAAGMVWDAGPGPSSSSQAPDGSRQQPFRNGPAGQRNGMPPRGGFATGPRPPGPRPPAPAPNKPPEAVKSQAALAAAKARFEQQQKENEEIAERNKRQRLGLPALSKPPAQETEIERLKRQIAEREAAAKAVKSQGPAVTKSAPPSPAKGRSKSRSPFPSLGPESGAPQSMSDPEDKPHRMKSSIVTAEPPDEQHDRWQPSEEGQSHSHRSSKDSQARDGRSAEHSRQNGSTSDRRSQRRERSRERERDAARREPSSPERHKSRSSRSGQTSDRSTKEPSRAHTPQPHRTQGDRSDHR